MEGLSIMLISLLTMVKNISWQQEISSRVCKMTLIFRLHVIGLIMLALTKAKSNIKNIFRRQNPLELVFLEISTFDAQNTVARSYTYCLASLQKGISESCSPFCIINDYNSILHQTRYDIYKVKKKENRKTSRSTFRIISFLIYQKNS